ncbi:MAG: acetate--CoA ligase family protein [Candidatus Latescibacterota bacterium]|jgi:acyl-CoA synthetase (NDP forming)
MEEVRRILAAAWTAGRRNLSEYESKRVLAAYGLPVTREEQVQNLGQARAAAARLGYPVALKVCGASVAHKTELGLVALNLKTAEELATAFARLSGQGLPADSGFLVQEMVSGNRELVLGLVRDPGFGPCVMLGLGGVFAEALADVTFRPAPLQGDDARRMPAELNSARLFQAFRGQPALDQEVLAACLTALGEIGLAHPEIEAIDVNPMIVAGSRPVAVDALVVLGDPSPIRETSPPPLASLEGFFSPRSVAVIGASATPHKPGNDVVRNLLANGYPGELYLVNPKGGEILGRPVHRSVAELPHGIDQAVVVLPAAQTPQVIRDCAAQGIKCLVLAAGGFAEVDEAGEALQAETLRAIEETGVRALGPNTAGHISTPARFTSSFFPLGAIPRGRISFIAQTGNFVTHTLRYMVSAEQLGVARVVGVGNKLDVEESEILEYLAQDEETDAIFVYLESFRRPRRFLEVAARVTRVKPVVLLKGGASVEGAKAAVAHTAALASDDRVVDGALRQAGVVRVDRYSSLILAAKGFAAMGLPRGNRVGFMAPSGAMLVCLTDLCRRELSLEVPDLEEKTRARLQAMSPAWIRMRNPVDIWPAAATRGVESAYREGAEVVLSDPNVDALVSVLMLADGTGVPSLDFLVDLVRQHPDKPHYVTFTGQREHMEAAKAFLEPRGVPTFPLIEEPFVVLDVLARCRRALERL